MTRRLAGNGYGDPAVSVVVATKDRPQPLRCALASIATQTLLAHERVEVIVVNDGGADVGAAAAAAEALGEVIDEVVDGAAAGHLAVRLLSLPSNQGLAAARNHGLAVARGAWVAFCDDDDVWLPQHLATALVAARGAGVELAHTSCAVAERRVTAQTAPTWLALACPVLFALPWDTTMLQVTNTVPVTGVICRNPANAGVWFDPTVAVQEDWRLWLTLADRGWRGVHVNHPTVVYHRLPRAASMTNHASRELAALRRFTDGARWVWEHWPAAPGSRIARCRNLVAGMYAVGEDRLRRGEPLAHCYYERSLPVLWQALHGEISDAHARAALEAVVTGINPPTVGDTDGRHEQEA